MEPRRYHRPAMRICIVTIAGYGLGGMQDHTRSLARGLAEAGHEVEVVTTRNPDGTPYEERDGARWHFVDAGAQHAWLPRRDPVWLPRSCEKFAELHGARPFDVIHSESTSAIGLVRRGIHRTVPTVAEFHGNAIALLRTAVQRARAGDASAKVRESKLFVWQFGTWLQYGHWYRFRPCVWIVPSRYEFEDTRRGAFLQGHLGRVVPNGVEPDRFHPRPRAALRKELALPHTPLFVAVGRLNAEKGMDKAIQALARLGEPSARLVIVGDGEDRDALEQLADELGVGDRVLFAGVQPHELVAKYMAAADVFLFPTMRAEAAPLVLPQAMACGVPVVASDIGGITEVVRRSGEYGVLVPPGEVEPLVSAMETLLGDEELRVRLGDAARRRILADYTVERMVDETLSAYRFAIARFASARASNGRPGQSEL
jgi:glycosyltransferase involved in cell wall biosynthesis